MTSLRFDRVDLDAFRGFPGQGFGLAGLHPGIVVVHGPNGAGKSSLVEAMELLLWEALAAPEGTSLHAQVQVGGQRQERTRTQRLTAREGLRPVPASPWASPATRERYRLSLADLLQANQANQAFSDHLRQDMQGGVDFQAHRRACGGQTGFSRRTAATAACEQAETAVREQAREQGQLESLEADIRRLRAEQATQGGQQQAERRLLALDQALGELEDMLEREAALAPWAGREALLARLQDGDASRFQELVRARDQARDQAGALAARLEALAAELAPLGLAPDLRDTTLQATRDLAQALQAAETGAAAAEQAHGAAEAALADWQQANPWLAAPAPGVSGASGAPVATQAVLEAAARLSRRFELTRGLVHALRQLETELGPAEALPPAEALAGAGQLLERWLEAAAALDAQARRPPPRGRWGGAGWALLAAGLLAGLGALARGCTGRPDPLLLGATAAALVLLALAALGLRARPLPPADPAELQRRLAALQDQFAALRLPGLAPAAWTPAELAVLAGRIRAEAARSTGLAPVNELRGRIRARLAEESARWSGLRAEAGELGRQLDLPEPVTEAFGGSLDFLCRRLQDGLALRGAAAVALDLHYREGERLAGLRAQAAAQLRACGREPGPEAAALAVLARDLETALRLRAEQGRLQGELARLRADPAAAALQAFLDALGLAEPGFAEAWAARQDWRPVAAAWRDQRSLVEVLFTREAHWPPAFQAIADRQGPLPGRRDQLAQARAGLGAQLRTVQAALARITESQGEAARKQAQLDRLTRAGTLAALILARDEAAQRLEEQRQQDLERITLSRLIDRLEQRGAEADLKPQLRRASELFEGFTRSRYQLRFEAGGFVAREGHQTLGLEQLSAGTRVQLLMAVRLAYVEHQETSEGPQLPLFLDEVLANSDDSRAMAIIEAIQVMAGTGRQIFYFTAQQDEVAKWRTLGPRDLQIIDLAQLRRLAAQARIPLPAADPARPAVPLPGGGSLLDYARQLGAPGPALWIPLARQHSWLAFGEGGQAALHGFLQGGLDTLGQLRTCLQGRTGPEPERLAATLALLQEAQDELQAARPRPLTEAELERADLRGFGDKGNLLDGLRECGGDPGRLLAMAIPGVGSVKRESLREWLLKAGHLVERAEPAEAILARLKGRHGDRLALDAPEWLPVERFLLGCAD